MWHLEGVRSQRNMGQVSLSTCVTPSSTFLSTSSCPKPLPPRSWAYFSSPSSLSYIIQSFGGLLVHMCSPDPLGPPTWTQSVLQAMLNLDASRCLWTVLSFVSAVKLSPQPYIGAVTSSFHSEEYSVWVQPSPGTKFLGL